MIACRDTSFRRNPWIDFSTIRAVGDDEVEQLKLAAAVSIEARLIDVHNFLPSAASANPKDLDPVHDLRVSTRRTIAALDLYQDLLPDELSTRISKTMNVIRKAAGDARDLDVLIKRLKSDDFDNKKQLIKLLRKRRARAQRPLLKLSRRLMKNNQFQKSMKRILEEISDFGTISLTQWASDSLWLLVNDLESLSRRIEDGDSELHAFRIALKQFRYRIELLADLFDEDLRLAVYPQVCEMQDRLGEINDHFAAAKQFRSLRKWSIQKGKRKLTRRLKRWQQTEKQVGKQLAAEFLQSYEHEWTIRLRESLASVLASQSGTSPRVASC